MDRIGRRAGSPPMPIVTAIGMALVTALATGFSVALATGIDAGGAAAVDEQGESATGQTFGDSENLARANRVATRALQWLSGRVRRNGSIDMSQAAAGERAEHQPKLSSTALTALAFMANGHTADDGDDGDGARVRGMVSWLLSQASEDDCNCAWTKGPHKIAKFIDPGFDTSPMHEQGYVTWALAMAYGMSLGKESVDQRTDLARVTQGAVHCIELAQNRDKGGWFYYFTPEADAHEGSVTVTALEALRSAKEAGLIVDAGVIELAVGYLRESQVREADNSKYGAFRYRLRDPITSFALTAAAVSSLNQTGEYDSKSIDLGIEFMRQTDPLTHFTQEPMRFTWYGYFYATQAFWQYRELRHFRSWYPALVEFAERDQDRRDGHFGDALFGDVYATAMAALTLGVPFGYLPSFQR